MNIAIYSAFFSPKSIDYVKTVIDYLNSKEYNFILLDRIKKYLGDGAINYNYFKDDELFNEKVDFLFSIGGDGTLLRSVSLIKDSKIPILGINAGRLGFLTTIKKNTLEEGLNQFFEGKYDFVERSLLEVSTKYNSEASNDFGYALNEVTINRKNTTSMLSIDTRLNDQHLTTYSLSSGGPIVTPSSKCLVINPIAPHNINMRPLIVPEETTLEISVKGRGNTHLLSLDSKIFTIENGNDIYIKKADFNLLTIQLHGTYFFDTLREKFFWGHDSRNTQ